MYTEVTCPLQELDKPAHRAGTWLVSIIKQNKLVVRIIRYYCKFRRNHKSKFVSSALVLVLPDDPSIISDDFPSEFLDIS